MKTKIILLFGAIGLITLSFTFTADNKTSANGTTETYKASDSAPVGGLFADDVVE